MKWIDKDSVKKKKGLVTSYLKIRVIQHPGLDKKFTVASLCLFLNVSFRIGRNTRNVNDAFDLHHEIINKMASTSKSPPPDDGAGMAPDDNDNFGE